jgi:hypothetical protein
MDMKDLRRMKEAGALGGHWDVGERCKEGVSFLREIFGEVILVISGRTAGCTKALSQRSEGAIFSKRSKPQGTDSSPHDAATIIADGLK